MSLTQKKFLVIAGPTASGKSALAFEIAHKIGAEIVSCDSVQVYRGFDIGAAKPSSSEQLAVPHHLIDIRDWHDDYDAARFARDARAAIDDIVARNRVPVVVGGTGLYLRALLQQAFHDDMPSDETLREKLRTEDPGVLYKRLQKLDPVRAAEIHPHDMFRVVRALELNILLGGPVSEKTKICMPERSDEAFLVILDPPRGVLHERIAARTAAMLDAGLLREVEGLLERGIDPDSKPMQSIGYKQCVDLLKGKITREDLAPKIIAATRQYAKRQCTWFRKMNPHVLLSESTLDPAKMTALLRQAGKES